MSNVKVEKQEPVAWARLDTARSIITENDEIKRGWELDGLPFKSLFDTPQLCPECPGKDQLIAEQNRLNKERQEWALKNNETIRSLNLECEKLKADVAELEGCRELNRCAIKNLKAEHDKLSDQYISLQENCDNKQLQVEELAAQVEKMRDALKLSERCFDLIKDVKGPLDCNLILKSELVIKTALSTPDPSTGILNMVRAESLRKAADIAKQWGDGRLPDSGGNALRNCATHLRTLAADMEAGK